MGKIKPDLDLPKLEIFYWVAELGSFSQAAELFSLRQPTVSAHIQELEKSLGGKLLYRIRGRIIEQLMCERGKLPVYMHSGAFGFFGKGCNIYSK